MDYESQSIEQKAIRKAKQKAFCKAFPIVGTKTKALEAAQVGYNTFTKWYKYDPDFKVMYEIAERELADKIEYHAMKRAIEGHQEVLTFKGAIMYERNRVTGEYLLDDNFERIPVRIDKAPSNRLMERLLEAKVEGYQKPNQNGPNYGILLSPGDNAGVTVNINFSQPPKDWNEIEWDDDGRPRIESN